MFFISKRKFLAALAIVVGSAQFATGRGPFTHDPPPVPYCPDGVGIPNSQFFAYYPTRWRQWPGVGPLNRDEMEDRNKPAVTKPGPEVIDTPKAITKPKNQSTELPPDDEDAELLPAPPTTTKTKPPTDTKRTTKPDNELEDMLKQFQNENPFRDEIEKTPEATPEKEKPADEGASRRGLRKLSDASTPATEWTAKESALVTRTVGRRKVPIITPPAVETSTPAPVESSPTLSLMPASRGTGPSGETAPIPDSSQQQLEPEAHGVFAPMFEREQAPAAPSVIRSTSRRSAAARAPQTPRRTLTGEGGIVPATTPISAAREPVDRADYIATNPLRKSSGKEREVVQTSWSAPDSDRGSETETNPLRRR